MTGSPLLWPEFWWSLTQGLEATEFDLTVIHDDVHSGVAVGNVVHAPGQRRDGVPVQAHHAEPLQVCVANMWPHLANMWRRKHVATVWCPGRSVRPCPCQSSSRASKKVVVVMDGNCACLGVDGQVEPVHARGQAAVGPRRTPAVGQSSGCCRRPAISSALFLFQFFLPFLLASDGHRWLRFTERDQSTPPPAAFFCCHFSDGRFVVVAPRSRGVIIFQHTDLFPDQASITRP